MEKCIHHVKRLREMRYGLLQTDAAEELYCLLSVRKLPKPWFKEHVDFTEEGRKTPWLLVFQGFFCLLYFETVFLCIALAIRELTL